MSPLRITAIGSAVIAAIVMLPLTGIALIVAPLSLVVSSFAPVNDVRLTLTPDLKPDGEGEVSCLVYVNLGAKGEAPLGATALAQVYGQLGNTHADADAATLKRFFNAMQKIVREKLARAYHDRSDGGLAVTLAEMAITGGRGVAVRLPDGDALEQLFNEQPGAVLQVTDSLDTAPEKTNVAKVMKIFRAARIEAWTVGAVWPAKRDFEIYVGERLAIKTDITCLRRAWSETTYRMQALRKGGVRQCARRVGSRTRLQPYVRPGRKPRRA